MNEDFKLLLTEYNRAASLSPNFTDSPAIIPILLKNGAFSPSRLERWPFAQISDQMEGDAGYRAAIVSAFEGLVRVDPEVKESKSFLLNEKKAVSFLLATRDSFPKIHQFLEDSITRNLRIHLAALEYGLYTKDKQDLRRHISLLPIPMNQSYVELVPKLSAKYLLLMEMLKNPSIELAKDALNKMMRNEGDSIEEGQLVLDCAARSFDSKLLYSEIITPIWNTPNKTLAVAVLESMRLNGQLSQFCTEYLNKGFNQ